MCLCMMSLRPAYSKICGHTLVNPALEMSGVLQPRLA